MGLKDLLPETIYNNNKEVVELPVEAEEPTEKVNVRIETMSGLVDIERFEKLLRQGNILFLKTRQLQRQDIGQFQMAAQKLKMLSHHYGYDLAATEEGYFVLTPPFASIARDA